MLEGAKENKSVFIQNYVQVMRRCRPHMVQKDVSKRYLTSYQNIIFYLGLPILTTMVRKVKVLLIVSGNINDNINGVGDDVIDDTVIPLKFCLKASNKKGLFLFVKKLAHIDDCLRLFNVFFCLKRISGKLTA